MCCNSCNQGWVCPLCGKSFAPWVRECPYCRRVDVYPIPCPTPYIGDPPTTPIPYTVTCDGETDVIYTVGKD